MELASKPTKMKKRPYQRPFKKQFPWLILFMLLLAVAGWLVYRHLTPVRMGQSTVGFTPLTELGSGSYHGAQGGLYPGGSNERPSDHEAAGVAIAKTIRPLASDGTVDEQNGKIGFVAVGMSNTSIEFETFLEQADEIPHLNPAVVLVDGAQHSKASQFVANPDDDFWPILDGKIADAGLSAAQVQVVWLKEARAYANAPFPIDALMLKSDLRKIVTLLYERFPNLKIIYLSSRTYGGYATVDLNPEPYAYQSAFAVKWLIEDQIEGDAGLNFDSNNGSVTAPWLSWGPYLWADGLADEGHGFVWEQSDFAYDGTHTSPSGQAKVAGLLYYFLRTDETAVPWFLSSN
ncbi:MAG: hypothetical protein KC433_07300 [Anaerolineales bacterium]|nr:hypothetical protein [Anaerolineales bacterium]MCB8942076.1 hypothetical protein [Ardenticatenaceae bacterium]